MEGLLAKFKSKNAKFQQNVPKIQVIECVSDGDLSEETLLQQANEAKKLLDKLLQNSKFKKVDLFMFISTVNFAFFLNRVEPEL